MAYFDYSLQELLKSIPLVMYLRKSSEDNEDKQMRSIERQEDDLKELIKRLDIEKNIIKVIKEEKSAFKVGREGFEVMMKMFEDGTTKGEVVWHPNRNARNYQDGGRFVQLMSDGKLKFVITPFAIYTDNSRDKAYLMDEYTKATRDSDDKSDAVISGYRRKLKEGYIPSGRLQEGYIHIKDKRDRKINGIDKRRFILLQKAANLILDGIHTPMEALNILNEEWKYKTRKTKRMGGKPLAKSTWYKILSSPINCGDLSGRKNTIEGQRASFNTLFSPKEFEKLQIILGRKDRPRITKHKFEFKQLLKCGECGGSITCEEKWQVICSNCKTKFHKAKLRNSCPSCNTLISEMNKPKILHYVYYRCTKKVNKNCSQGSFRLDILEKQVDKELQKYEISEKFRDWAIEYLNELNDDEVSDRELVRKNLKEAYDDCVKKLDNLLKLKISPQNINESVISEKEYLEQRKYLLQEKEDLQDKLNNTNQRINNWLELSEKTFNFACYARHWFSHGDLETRAQILDALGSNLIIKDRKLQIDGQKHWFLIEKGKQDIVLLAKKFEPIKWLELLGKSELPEAFRMTWLGD